MTIAKKLFPSNPCLMLYIDNTGEMRIKLQGDKTETVLFISLLIKATPQLTELKQMVDFCLKDESGTLQEMIKHLDKPQDKKFNRN